MGIKFYCPNGHKLNVKSFLAGKRGVCPHCDASVVIPLESQIPSRKKRAAMRQAGDDAGSGPTSATATLSPPAMATPGYSRGPDYSGGPIYGGAQAAVSYTNHPDPVQPAAPTSGPANYHNVGASPASGAGASMPVTAGPPVPTSAGPTSAAPNPGMVAPATSGPASQAAPGHPVGPGTVPTAPAAQVASIPTGTAVQTSVSRGWDPVAEAPQAVWFVRPPSGGQFGPARGEIMRKWVAEGRVTADSMVWREGWSDWRDAGPVFPELPTPPPAEPGPGHAGSDLLTGPGSPDSASSRTAPRSRRRKSPAMAIVTVTVLVLVSLGLLITLVYVLSNG